MKSLISKGLVVLLLVLSASTTMASNKEFSKKLNQSYRVNADAVLEISNRFGKIHCTTWEQNEVAIEVTIRVAMAKEEKAQEMLDQIQVEFTGSREHVRAITQIQKLKMKGPHQEMEIDFYVKMPNTLHLDFENKFGDIVLGGHQGPVDITVGYGTCLAVSLPHPENRFQVSFGKLKVDEQVAGKCVIKYSDMKIRQAVELEVESSFSELKLLQVDDLELDSRYDELQLGELKKADIECSFSDLEIDQLSQVLRLQTRYGGCEIERVQEGFHRLDINNQFGHVELGFAPAASFALEAQVVFARLRIPERESQVQVVEETATRKTYSGVVGKDSSPSAQVDIESKNGGVEILYR